MKWSKVRQRVEDTFADSVRGRVHVYSTVYLGSCSRGWFTIDGEDIADLSSCAAIHECGAFYHESTKTECLTHAAVPDEDRTEGSLVEKGEFSRFDLHEACWEYIHSNVNDCLVSENPILVSLAILNAKVGKTRLCRISQQKLHPLAKAMLEFRMKAEGMRVPLVSSVPIPTE